MLAPKKTKHRKQFRGTHRRIAIKGEKLNFGEYGLKTAVSYWITDRQLEAIRVILARETRKIGRYWIRIFPHKPYTKKPLEVGMGSGKGDVAYYVAAVAAGTVLVEISGVALTEVKRIFKKVTSKLPVHTRISYRNHDE